LGTAPNVRQYIEKEVSVSVRRSKHYYKSARVHLDL